MHISYIIYIRQASDESGADTDGREDADADAASGRAFLQTTRQSYGAIYQRKARRRSESPALAGTLFDAFSY